MKIRARWISGITAASLAVLAVMSLGVAIVHGQVQHVRWDIINFAFTTPPTGTAGGVAYASARTGGAPSGLKLKLTGFGTFLAPASGGEASGVPGGGRFGAVG